MSQRNLCTMLISIDTVLSIVEIHFTLGVTKRFCEQTGSGFI
ncbi:hypothetical protein MNV_200006 [Candidatus Methanoperedens nitroreducens]|uniref:Uncharacterized protein n=1 Tax=Candidatus Methanoperedens nitratireducens TaxID=1392998 RepID=A0A284VND7_9EURY|nr:hypothetical protein MNV_200006 [Candidatus Methanoperedens nitroreducens]